MTSHATRPAGATGAQAEGRGYGLVLFASILMLIVGIFNLIYGIAAIANSHVFVANAHYVFGNLRTWGWITLIIGALQLLAGGDQMFFIPAYPFWSLLIIAIDVVALYGLCAYGSRENLAV